MDKYKCKLLPYKKEDCFSIQDAKQKAGWGITAFNLPKAWELSQGEDVVIGVIDTGVDLDHPDLKNNLLDGINLVTRGKPPIDGAGHGSHVTGILVAENNDIGIVGVCPKAKVRPVKALNDRGGGNLLNVVDGIYWCIEQKVDFISMSLGTPNKVQQARKAIQAAAKAGIITFCAAGNAGKTADVFFPASYPETIAIGAIDEKFNRANFSNTGRNLDFMAPGVDILSTVPKNWYGVLSGSSMAAPFAVGVAALVLSYVKKGKSQLKLNCVEDYRALFRKYTTPITDHDLNDPEFYEGFGIIDPRKIIELADH